MANSFENVNRKVLPNFRPFADTLELGELNSNNDTSNEYAVPDISENIIGWNENPCIGTAGDLISCAIVDSNFKKQEIVDAAYFILQQGDRVPPTLISMSNKILNLSSEQLEYPINRPIPFDNDLLELNRKAVQIQKKASLRFPTDPIPHVELSLIYTCLGQKEKAIKHIHMAHALAPNNRYVIRSLVRVLCHYDQAEIAHKILSKKDVTKNDPWLLASEIALASMLEKENRLANTGFRMLNSKMFHDHSITELRSSLGTLELINGNIRKSRKLFRESLIEPNDNALAQAEWASTEQDLFDLDPNLFNVKRKHEALAFDSFEKKEWENVINNVWLWHNDLRYARRPILLGSHVSSVIMNDQNKAVTICEMGLKSNPQDSTLLNNLAYSLALMGKTDEANEKLNHALASDNIDEKTRICIIATQGLVNFRKGNFNMGRHLYIEAMEKAESMKDQSLAQLAMVNYVREELLIREQKVDELVEQIGKLKIDPKNIGLNILKDRVFELYEKQRTN